MELLMEDLEKKSRIPLLELELLMKDFETSVQNPPPPRLEFLMEDLTGLWSLPLYPPRIPSRFWIHSCFSDNCDDCLSHIHNTGH